MYFQDVNPVLNATAGYPWTSYLQQHYHGRKVNNLVMVSATTKIISSSSGVDRQASVSFQGS